MSFDSHMLAIDEHLEAIAEEHQKTEAELEEWKAHDEEFPMGMVEFDELTELYEFVSAGNELKRDEILKNWFDKYLGRII